MMAIAFQSAGRTAVRANVARKEGSSNEGRMRRASAGSRHLVLVATFASLLLLPFLSARLPIRLRVLPQVLRETRGLLATAWAGVAVPAER